MKKNTINATILNQKMDVAHTPEDAWRNGDKYFCAAEAEAYTHLTREQLSALLYSAAALQTESGHLSLFEDPTMPGDARTDIIYKPSYAIATIAIYTLRSYPDVFDKELHRFFRDLLEGAFQHGIIGHGIESEETVRRTLLMLCKAGVRDFLANNPNSYPAFAKAINRHMEYYLELAKQIDEKQIIVTANGFSPNSINHLVKELVAYWNGFVHPVFVYGTLMKGERAARMLSNCIFGGHFQLKDYAMYNLGAYPGICPCIGESVLGELYFVSDDVIPQLDQYEGEGYLYRRTVVQLCSSSSTFTAEAYVYNQDISNCKKMREIWNAEDEDLVWYAGYGSNLSDERFSCYISGGICAENGRNYKGSSDPTPARVIKKRSFPGSLYFGNSSPSWNNCGVAFFDPIPKNRDSCVYMKLYLITRRQLHDVMKQEGPSANWYGRLICLEVDDRGIPVYTLTSESHRPANTPAPAYTSLITGVLEKEFNLCKQQICSYLRGANGNT